MTRINGTVPAATTLTWCEDMMEYRFSATHPMDPRRLDLTVRLAEALEVLGREQITVAEPRVATDEQLLTVHDADYIAAVKAVGEDPTTPDPARGLGTEDNPAFAGMHTASARLAGGSIAAAEAVLEGSALHGVNFAGGMHHAGRGTAGGFCIYNDAALAIRRLLDGGVRRVLYIDVDAHHGDGVEQIFWDDDRVLTLSLHESGTSLYPGTGFPNEIGGAAAQGRAVNVALPAGTGDSGWLRAFHAVVPQLTAAFEPEVIVSQHGCDGHARDGLTNLRLSVDGQRQNMLDVAQLADQHAEGRWVALGGGGYDITHVVPRAWTHLLAIASGQPVPLLTAVPASWRDHVRERYGLEAPRLMGDDADTWWRSWEVGYDPADAVDRAIMATRKEVFPLYGLDPWFD
ncbi:acetoin utilization protein AcuC [Zhihengliuella halotolerans]|uniref:Acetoin utilization protein AcuC n=2 Tax=Zhihengliuella halotolerans TaxID=370736 RepID=A0A4Q8AFF4_9MICC|nr:acetoin utilization protein AcuC [Zhihengliuella halotolerans]